MRPILRATCSPAVCTSLTTTLRCLLPPVSSRTQLPPVLLPLALQDLWWHPRLALLLAPPALPPQQQPQLEQLSEKDATSLPPVLPAQLPGALALPAAAAAYAMRSCKADSDRTVAIARRGSSPAAKRSSAVRGCDGSRRTTWLVSFVTTTPGPGAHSLSGWLLGWASLALLLTSALLAAAAAPSSSCREPARCW